MSDPKQIEHALQLALKGEWDASHRIVQEYADPTSNWIHAVLHKIEGDEWNSRYWYKRTIGRNFEDYHDPNEELRFILNSLNSRGDGLFSHINQ